MRDYALSIIDADREYCRLNALHRYNVLDTPSGDLFDRITRLARAVLETPIALVSLFDRESPWFGPRNELEFSEPPRDVRIRTISSNRCCVPYGPETSASSQIPGNARRLRRYAATNENTARNGMISRICGHFGRCRRGVVAVEFALLSTLLMTIVFSFIASAMVFYTKSAMQSSAQYAALMVATGQITTLNTGTITTSNTTATTNCSSSLGSTQAEYYACKGLPSWATFTVTTTEACATPSVTVSLSVNATAAAIADVFGIFTGKTIVSNAVVMKQGQCP